MAKNLALQNRINLDLFKGPVLSSEELQRRLSGLVEHLNRMMEQIAGNLLVNVNVTYYGDEQKPDLTNSQDSEEKTGSMYAFNVTGDTLQIRFDRGKVIK